MGVHDLNFGLPICDARGFERPGVTHERGQDAFRAGDGVRAVEDLRSNCRAAQGRRGRTHAGLCRLVSRDGLRPAHMARVPSRHRSLPGSQSGQAVPHGAEGATGPLDAGRCLEPARLAHLPRAGSAADCARQDVVRPRAFVAGDRCQCLCTGLDHHRSVPEPVRVGAVSLHQGGHQAAHSAGLARRDPCLHPHQRRQAARRERAGHPARRSRSLLRDGSGLRGLRAAVRDASDGRLLRHPCQVGHGRAAGCTRHPPTAPAA